jgi:tetratricopeptide (TPR) repeat protein
MDNSAARSKIEQSLAANPKNAHGAQGFAHVGYESGEVDAARSFLSSWLTTYPCEGFFYGHRSWHLSLCEIQAGNWSQAFRLYQDAVALDQHSGGPQLQMSDGASFLWRFELAGRPRDTADWRGLYGYANSALPRPGDGLADLHVMLAQAVMSDDGGLAARTRQMDELTRRGRYPCSSYLPALARGFAAFEHGDFSGAIEALAPLAGDNERIGGSRAQHDLIEFTLLRANRLEEARRLLGARRPGAAGVPVLGVAAVHWDGDRG